MVHHHALLVIGSEQGAEQYTSKILQEAFCGKDKKADCFCRDCRALSQRKHHGVVWFCPEKGYVVDDIDFIIEKTALKLDSSSRFYFILEKAETLSQATANRLLKTLEEPAPGYNFILHVANEQALIPTVRSRCQIVHIEDGGSAEPRHPLLSFFTSNKQDPLAFMQELSKSQLTDSQSTELVQQLHEFFSSRLRACYYQSAEEINESQNRFHTVKIISYLHQALQKPPQSGSSTLFWKNFYLNFPTC